MAPATPRLASTVLLLRDTPAGPEVFVQRRAATMTFAANMTVFPGGGVADSDATLADAPWRGPGPNWWGSALDVPAATAAALVAAAVRETFEESGVLLAAGADGTGHSLSGRDADAARRDLESGAVTLSDFLTARDLIIRTDLLRPWANWLTPEFNPVRYDTFFFLAAMPDGQEPDGRTREAVSTGWSRPADLLAGWRAGEVSLMPPTWAQLRRLEPAGSVAEALDLARSPIPRTDFDFLGDPFMDEFFAVATHLGHLREPRA